MRRGKMKRIFSTFLAAALVFTMSDWGMGQTITANAGTISDSNNANFDFENGTDDWETTGTVTVMESGAQSGSKYLHMEAGSKIAMTITNVAQGSYTLSAWVKGTANKNASQLTVTETGGPDTVSLLDTYLGTDWKQMGNRNVLVYNGQMKITIEAGQSTLDIDNLELVLDSEDANTIANWDFEDGLDSWTTTGNAAVDTANADTGAKAIRLAAGSEISQKVTVEPNTRYSVTMRAKVDNQDEFETIYHSDRRGKTGETQNRTSLGDRVNLGVRGADGAVLRQAPSGTEGYSLVSITFETGADTKEVEVYANTVYDQAYKDSVTVYDTDSYQAGTGKLADEWQGNGSDSAYVDNFDLFRIEDENYLRGADVSFLPAIEDFGGKYFANGVQQDCLRILSNHGVNSILTMIMVHAGNPVHDTKTLEVIYSDWCFDEDGNPYIEKMIEGGYFDKEHSVELGKRATALGMSYVPSFHYSDKWMSNAKAHTPEEWLDVDYEGNYSNTDLAHMQSIVYNYVYDFMKALADENVNVAAVKHGNEQNGGLVWPVGNGMTSVGHAKIIAASYEAAEDAMPGVSGWVHSNNGYTPSQITSFFQALMNNGAKMDGITFSLYGGRSSGNTYAGEIAQQKVEAMKYMDYVNVETGFTFTGYSPTIHTANSSMGMAAYYRVKSPNGQYNWLLDYMQAALDAPNPYAQTRGFYYWETDWIPTPGAGSAHGSTSDINQRTMFNNGDISIKEMGSSQPGRAGDMMDSMYAYLMRGCPKAKSSDMQTPVNDGIGEYAVELADATNITLAQPSITLAEGKKTRLQPTIAPTDKVVKNSDVIYTSADPTVATVTTDGFVCAKKAGTTTITATVNGTNVKTTANVMVTAGTKAAGITLTLDGSEIADKGTKAAKIFDKLQLSAALAGTPTDTAVVYTSSNPEVASFFGETWQTPAGEMRQETEKDTKVQLNAKDAGTTIITVSSADGAASASFTLTVSKTAVQSVTLNKSEASVSYGRTVQLKATVLPADTSRYKVNWVSEDTSIATVDDNGLVKGVGIGDVVIKAVSDDNSEVYGSCTVHVLEVQVEGITLDREVMAVQIGSTKVLNTLITPDDAYNKNVTWSSSDETIATVNEKGEVTGVKVGGPVTITATTVNGGYQASCLVTVQQDAIPVTGITMSEQEYFFASDYFSETSQAEDKPVYRLHASIEPEMATNTNVQWTSDTPEVAAVDAFGRVTAVSPGVAEITATAEDGGYTASVKVYVPSVSESFDNLNTGDSWGTGVSSTGGGALTGAVTASDSGNILQISGGGSGARSIQKRLAKSISNNKIILDYDWNVGTVAGSNGCYMAITDSENNRYLSIQTNANQELVYSAGGKLVANTALTNTQQVGTGFNQGGVWYHIHAAIDVEAGKTIFTITSLANAELTATHEVAFDKSTSYAGDVAAIQFYGTRTDKSNLSWNPAIDNFNIYEAALVAKGVNINKESVRLIPIEGTLMASCQLEASINPASVDQKVVWTSSDKSVATVSADGLVTPVNVYQSLDEIEPATCTIKVASALDASVYKEIPVTVTNSPNASEFFAVKDENGETVYGGGESELISMETAGRKQLFPILTGGDGDTDIAGIKWESGDSKIVGVDGAGNLIAKAPGTATITLTVTLYEGNPQIAQIDVEVTGDAIVDTTDLEDAIAAAKAAKDKGDSWYTPDSLAAYTKALTRAESDFAAAVEEKWEAHKQSVIDAVVEALKLATEGLKLVDYIPVESLEVSGCNEHLSIGKTVELKAAVTPAGATEEIHWFSSDTSVAVVDKLNGTLIPVGEGTAKITAQTESGGVKVEKTITVSSDLTSYFDENGVTITGNNTAANRDVKNTFINARTTDQSSWETGNVWTTGSATTTGSIVIDFGEKARIDNVKTVFWSLLKYTLDISDDGENWTTVIDHSETAVGAVLDNNGYYTDEFPADTQSRYLRINVLENGGTGWIGVNTMQVNGAYLSEVKVPQSVTCEPISLGADAELAIDSLPQTISVTLSDGTTQTVDVTWNELDLQKVIAAEAAGEYQVHGTVTIDNISYDVVCALTLSVIDISDAAVILEENSFQYTGTAKQPGVTVELDGKTLSILDYTVTYSNNVEIGTATVTIEGIGKYTGTITEDFEITKGDLGNAIVTLEKNSYVYTGTAKEPQVTVRLDGKTISESEYTVTYADNVNAGTAKVTIAALADSAYYTGSISKNFEIAKGDLNNATVTLEYESCIYTGEAKEPQVIVTLDGVTVPIGDYIVSYENNVNIGTASVIIEAAEDSGNYTGSVTKTFVIKDPADPGTEKSDLGKATVTLEYESCIYTGAAKEPRVTVTLDGTTVPASEYEVIYANNINVGTASVTIKAVSGSESYTGSITKNFEIIASTPSGTEKGDLSKATVALQYTSCTYTGLANTPKVTVALAGKIVPASGYTVNYANNINAGTATVTIVGKGDYNGRTVKTFTIGKAAKQIKLAKKSYTKVYGNKAFALGATVTGNENLTYSLSNKTVIKVTNGKAKIIGCGTVTVTVKSAASANYNAAANQKIKITVKSKKATISSAKSTKKGQITLKWKKDSKASGYIISYSTSKKFKKAKTAIIKKKSTVKTTLKKLSAGKTYYVRICSYKKVGKKRLSGAYSKVKKVTVKKR